VLALPVSLIHPKLVLFFTPRTPAEKE
jgi:hypothetical protein